MVSPHATLKFQLTGPSEFPKRTASGAPVKLWLVRAMAEGHDLMRRAHDQADRLVEATRKIDTVPPPKGNGKCKPEEGK